MREGISGKEYEGCEEEVRIFLLNSCSGDDGPDKAASQREELPVVCSLHDSNSSFRHRGVAGDRMVG